MKSQVQHYSTTLYTHNKQQLWEEGQGYSGLSTPYFAGHLYPPSSLELTFLSANQSYPWAQPISLLIKTLKTVETD